MTSLAIAGPLSRNHDGLTVKESLLENALWLPDIPQSNLQWNMPCFTATEDLTTSFRPLCYVLFKDIPDLTRVTAFSTISGILAIDFHDSAGNVRRLGPKCFRNRKFETTYFPINGRGGEKIIRIDIHKHKKFDSFKVSNYFIFRRSC